jgi:tellurite resistance protein
MHDVQVLRAACCIAGIDGEVCDKEQPLLQRLAEEAGVGAMSLTAMIEMSLKDPKFYEQQLKYSQKDPEKTIRTLFLVAAADGKFTSEERVMLHHFAMKVGMSDEQYDALVEEEKAKLKSR